ncbi:response regulator [Domibacillus sp. DTU_2020_1001157_1_SI_ALB_TIR_016]|uniref:response regulator transcription factor n=1 Tax=Domibacillus sp. DTU_2020_1001157_1_SI_ALB_TIR_016 TaxID=3077789 RepID=UPI0028E4BEFF|nr:response regulator [Domibacillus sp. DTU_2020_1001157_1_SI_ALB_TIR_016]WNS78882.1 response regulator [Domibacillus sp. DTU_2020_1001157_1_SI_ALB_TIR_016]
MKVIVVDDEMIERKAMRKLLEQHIPQIQVVGEAGNGRVAIELAESLHPDLMLMDIKMPGMNGLEAIRHIRLKQPSIRFIMMTAYASFDYAREAMIEGVKHYLVKPAKRDETIQTILQVQEEVKEEQASEAALWQLVLAKVMQQDMNEEVCRRLRMLHPEAKVGFMHVYECPDANTREDIIEQLNEHSPFPFLAAHPQAGGLAVLFLSKECQKSDVLLLAKSIVRSWPGKITVGTSAPCPLKQLGSSYSEALLAFQQLKAGRGASYGFADQSASFSHNAVEKAIMNRHPLDTLFTRYSLNQLKEELVHVKKEMAAIGVYVDDVNIMEAAFIEDCLAFGNELASRVAMHRQGREMIAKAKTFIHTHFHQQISLEDVADHVQLSPTYFTKLFKEKMNETFIGYLTNYRIRTAKKLLQHTNLGLKEIADRTGYNDPNYFSRVFKKAAGCSPKEYRKSFS